MISAAEKFPQLRHGKPDWPSKDDEHLFWVGLCSTFSFSHHPAKRSPSAALSEVTPAEQPLDAAQAQKDYFCTPIQLKSQMIGVLNDSTGGSILVTGYRGTGKTSLVNECVAEFKNLAEAKAKRSKKEKKRTLKPEDLAKEMEKNPQKKTFLRVPINLATVTTAQEVLVLAMETLATKLDEESRRLIDKFANKAMTEVSDCVKKKAEDFIAGITGHCVAEMKESCMAKVIKRLRTKILWMCPPKVTRLYLDEEDGKIALSLGMNDKLPLEVRRLSQAEAVKIDDEFKQKIAAELNRNFSAEFKRWIVRRLSGRKAADLSEKSIDEFNSSVVSELNEKISELGKTLASQLCREIIAHRLDELPVARRALESESKRLRAAVVVQNEGGPGLSLREDWQPDADNVSYTYDRKTLSSVQSSLVGIIEKLSAVCEIVFVFDELDKLPTEDEEHEEIQERSSGLRVASRKLKNFQNIVADLKHFLSEAKSHQIFIAGKDVDDSWTEDQNKGEGLFESIFACNIYVPSIFSTQLSPCVGGISSLLRPEVGEKELERFYKCLAREIGIMENSWTYNTALLILPFLAEYEVLQLLKRAQSRKPQYWFCEGVMASPPLYGPPIPPGLTLESVGGLNRWHQKFEAACVGRLDRETLDPESGKTLDPMSERTCRRLRILLEYLTYKGRGIPRKIGSSGKLVRKSRDDGNSSR